MVKLKGTTRRTVIFKFKTIRPARKKQIEIKRQFGFKPRVMKFLTPEKKRIFVVVRGKGMTRLK